MESRVSAVQGDDLVEDRQRGGLQPAFAKPGLRHLRTFCGLAGWPRAHQAGGVTLRSWGWAWNPRILCEARMNRKSEPEPPNNVCNRHLGSVSRHSVSRVANFSRKRNLRGEECFACQVGRILRRALTDASTNSADSWPSFSSSFLAWTCSYRFCCVGLASFRASPLKGAPFVSSPVVTLLALNPRFRDLDELPVVDVCYDEGEYSAADCMSQMSDNLQVVICW